MQNLILSMVRFSAAVTLYSLEQLQTTMYVTQGGQDLFKVMDKLEIALNALTESLVDKMDKSKKDTLKSITNIAEEVVNRSFDGLNAMDPRELLRTTSSFVQKSSGAVTGWMGKDDSSDGAEPKPAAEVLH